MDISETPILANLHARLTLPEKLWLLAKIYYWKFVGVFTAVGQWLWESNNGVAVLCTALWIVICSVVMIVAEFLFRPIREKNDRFRARNVRRETFEVEKATAYAALGLPAPTPENQHIYTDQFRTSCTYYTGPMPMSSYYTISPKQRPNQRHVRKEKDVPYP